MTDEEIETLRCEVSRELDELLKIPDEQLKGRQRKHRAVLRARKQALDKLRKARADGNLHQETRASLDYTLLTEYGERNVFLYNIMKARLSWW